jgi:hypothetical protein
VLERSTKAERNATHLYIPSNWNSRRFIFARLKPYCSTSVKCVFAIQRAGADHVRFGSKADIAASPTNVRFTPNSGHQDGDLTKSQSAAARAIKWRHNLAHTSTGARVLARSDRPENHAEGNDLVRPPEIWTAERLQQAACDELARHGGSRRDLEQLKAQFRKAGENKSADVLSRDNNGCQTGNIPS